MPCNSTTMIRTARQEFDHLLDSLREHAEGRSTAYQVERDLFTRLLALGRLLLKIFFAHCARRSAQQKVTSSDGMSLSVHSHKPRRYVSVFGEIEIERPYFWARGEAGRFPMDEALSLPEDTYSDLLREQADLLSGKMAYGEASAVIEELLGLSLSTSVFTRLVERDGGEVQAFYADRSPPKPSSEAPVLVAQADGKGVPMRPASERPVSRKLGKRSPVRLGKGQKRTKKKEAVVTSLHTTGRRVRSVEEVLDSFFSPPEASSPPGAASRESSQESSRGSPSKAGPQNEGPQNKKVWATLEGKDVAFDRLSEQVQRRNGPHVTDRVALSDGCRALQDRFREQLPRFELILDFVHVTEYLWKAANALFEEAGEERLDWVIERSRELLTGGHEAVLARLRRASTRSDDACAQAARYFERNAEAMDYARYLARGWPIATGVIEGACRHLVKDRCEMSGMRWNAQGAEQVLGLRAVWTNGDWDAYHQRRREQRHQRLYGRPLETTDTLEEQMWRMAA
jgi:hypothetical protein